MKKYGFTLVELMITVGLMSLILAFALPNYRNVVRNADERNALSNIMAVDGAAKLYRARNSQYLMAPLGMTSAVFNPLLGSSIVDGQYTYQYFGVSFGGGHYYVLAIENVPSSPRWIYVCDPNPGLGICVNASPCCNPSFGTCGTLPACW